ncbi:exopolysaccharide biosynthesis polyprenyl glycosylphosphotransferase [Aliivibrio salmonicida]|uniref:exopolysaccharide biosynthesis polyprenyl glycosylphosphotransferase n=1 Tax=Aliivibrio salmonicida TaxID=40269 RepID=UPI003D0DDDE4
MKLIDKLLSSSYASHSAGLFITLSGLYFLSQPIASSNTVSNSFWLVGICYLIIANLLPLISKYLLVERKYYIFPVTLSVYTLAFILILMLRIDYSRYVISIGLMISFIWFYVSAILREPHKKLYLSAIGNFKPENIEDHKNIELSYLSSPYNVLDISSGLVTDLHGELTAEQEKFIADCSVNNIPVFHIESIREMVSGRVQVNHLSENAIGTLQPNPLYHVFKRFWESLLILVTLPITLPIMLVTALLIKLENPGTAMFIQERIGQGGKVFKIYKFRSMTVKQKNAGDKFATEEQARITKVGKVIRKVRIDELPQFFNVLKGEMALIGPRPEQESFVKQFEEDIPFYGYRHMVKPGITGWAQTVQGYADDTDSTRVKLSYDLYYIKHISFWLDANIVFKTIRTMLTGFGAK